MYKQFSDKILSLKTSSLKDCKYTFMLCVTTENETQKLDLSI